MKQGLFEIVKNQKIADKVYEMTLKGDTSDITSAGQFVNIRIGGNYLRRPISVCDLCGDLLTIVFKTVGKGTEELSAFPSAKSSKF